MSSPIAIPRAASSASLPAGLYVPVHKRTGSSPSPSTSRSPSPTPLSESADSWRTHSPSKSPAAAFRKHRKTPSNASHHSIDHTTHIPTQSMIPRIVLPNTYSIHDLLALSSSPAPLAPEKVETLTGLLAFTAAPESNDKAAATRRRRTGRKGKKPQPQPIETVEVEKRRARHGHHGAFGFMPLAGHPHDLESEWRHAPAVAVVA